MGIQLTPYEGIEPYVFVSYCHKDKGFVYPMIQNLSSNGYRVWFDNGIHAGDDWLEAIAEHIKNCEVCIAWVSEAASNSHNCKNEVNYALEHKKTLLPIVQSKFEMSSGFRLLIGSTQFIKAYDYDLNHPEEAVTFYTKLLDSDSCTKCRKKEYAGKPFRVTVNKAIEPRTEILYVDKDGNYVSDLKLAFKKITRVTDSIGRVSETVEYIRKSVARFGMLIDLKSGVAFRLSSSARIGRESTNEVYIQDNTVGRYHALISLNNEMTATITDLDSTNGTFIFGERLVKGDTAPIYDRTILSFARRHFLYLENDSAVSAVQAGMSAVLECVDTGEIVGLDNGFVLGRDNPWPNGTFSEKDQEYKYLSHNHGQFQQNESGFFFLSGQSTNGTFFNGSLLEPGQSTRLLTNGDEISPAGKHRIKYYAIKLKENIL